jgi:hypothetical protein
MQLTAMYVLIALTAAYVGRAGARTIRSAPGIGPASCGSCGKCAASPEPPSRRVALDLVSPTR